MSDSAAQLQRRFGEAVRVARKQQAFSQEQLAEEAGISLTYAGEIERGEKMASLEIVVRIAKALRLRTAELIDKAGL